MAKKVREISSDEVIDEKKILKEAEERDKERKEQEKEEKAEAKAETKEKVKKEKVEKVEKKHQVRRQPRHGKKYRQIAEQIERGKEYPLNEAIELALKTSPAKFDATVEVHFALNEKEKNIRGTSIMPGGVAKEKRVLGVTDDNVDQLVADVKAGKVNFDILVAEPKMMPRLAPLAKTLGPKGLMPSPKAGTVVADVDKAVEELKSGKVEYRADKNNVVHMPLGKISFGHGRIKQNYDVLFGHLPKKVDSIYITTTMGPSIKVAKK